MTVISKSTIEVLKNFCSINKSIVIKPGNKVATLSINKNILAIADVQEQFDSQISIYDLGVFLGGLSLFDQPKSTLESNYVTVSGERGRSKTRFFYADPDVIVQPPEKEIDLPSTAVKFFLPHHHCNSCSVLLVSINPDLCLHVDNGTMVLSVTDRNETSNVYSVEVGESEDEFCYCFKVENLKLLTNDYNVSISNQNVALFKGDGIKYFIALEP